MIIKALYDLLSKSSGIKALVDDRIYPLRIPQGDKMPAIIYQLISKSPSNTKDGVSKLDIAQLQINVYADTFDQCDQIISAIRTTLDRYRGIVKGVKIDKINFINEYDTFDDEAQLYMKGIDFSIRIKL